MSSENETVVDVDGIDTAKVEEAATPEPESSVVSAPDPFDPERLRLSASYADHAAVVKKIVMVPVRKPANQDFVRVHPHEDYRLSTGVLEVKEDREMYLVEPELLPEISTESAVGPQMLVTAINRQDVLFLWPVRLPGFDGRTNSWSQSAMDAMTLAKEDWIRMTANMSLGGYDVFRAASVLQDPVWPDLSFREILEIAFKDKVIDTIDHPILRRLRGEI